jgi:hypothetical protein
MKVKTCLHKYFRTEHDRLRQPVSLVQFVAGRGSRKATYNTNYFLTETAINYRPVMKLIQITVFFDR